jgi:hypothetical protein
VLTGGTARCALGEVPVWADADDNAAVVLVLRPEQLALDLDWPLDEKTRDKIEKKEIKPSKWIRVEAARAVVDFGQTTRSRGRTKVVMVYPADRLNVESANTLLKTLEEPAGDLRFVLATESAQSLLLTIRSRCLSHALAWPPEAEALAWLRAQVPGSDTSHAQVWLRASGGRPSDALNWARTGLTATQWAQLPKAVAAGDGGRRGAAGGDRVARGGGDRRGGGEAAGGGGSVGVRGRWATPPGWLRGSFRLERGSGAGDRAGAGGLRARREGPCAASTCRRWTG